MRSGGVPLDELLRLLKDPNPDVRKGAIHVLVRYAPGQIPREDLISILHDADPGVQEFAAYDMMRSSPGLISRQELVLLLASQSRIVSYEVLPYLESGRAGILSS